MFELMFRHDLLEGAGSNLRESSLPLFAALQSLTEEAGRLRSHHICVEHLDRNPRHRSAGGKSKPRTRRTRPRCAVAGSHRRDGPPSTDSLIYIVNLCNNILRDRRRTATARTTRRPREQYAPLREAGRLLRIRSVPTRLAARTLATRGIRRNADQRLRSTRQKLATLCHCTYCANSARTVTSNAAPTPRTPGQFEWP